MKKLEKSWQTCCLKLAGRITAIRVIKKEKIKMRKSQGVGSDFTRKLSSKRKLFGPHVFGARLKTTQKWDDLGQVGIDNAMFDPT